MQVGIEDVDGIVDGCSEGIGVVTCNERIDKVCSEGINAGSEDGLKADGGDGIEGGFVDDVSPLA